MEREDDPQLWDLLAHSHPPEPSHFFSRNVLRAIREEPSSSRYPSAWLSWRRLVPAMSAVAAAVLAIATLHPFRHAPSAATSDSIASFNVSDSELATDLDVLTGDDDTDDSPLL
jgi:hypothetical protein